MPEQYYKEALKAGLKEKRYCVGRGQYPYLPVLEEIVSEEQMMTGVKLGVAQIPEEFIVGTKNSTRTNAFAGNFMPLLPEHTEFAEKWRKLCKAHLEEGIRNPVKVYEYMNRYYVEEGNKRVSVMKFFSAISIPAEVIRVFPTPSDSEDVKCYYEFLEFYKYSNINYLEFTREGSYEKLLKILGKEDRTFWTEEERKSFRANYYYFKQMFENVGGSRLEISTGDALLAYLQIYDYESFRRKTGEQIRQEIRKMWEELELLREQQSIDLILNPEEKKKESFLHKIIGEDTGVKKVAFLYDKEPATSGWTYGHELGRQHVQNVFHGQIITTAYQNVMEREPEQVIEQAIADGNRIIFTTSPKLLNASLAAAVKYPEEIILNCSVHKPHRYIRTYYARMYEAKFIIGAIAGALTDNDKVGYLCDYPIFGQIAGINAFAMGVQMVNPRAKVHLEWTCVADIHAQLQKLRGQGISLISSQDWVKTMEAERSPFGLFRYDENGRTNLAMPVWNWGIYYEKLIRSILNRTMRMEYESSNKALNYYWGMSAGVVELMYSHNLPVSVRKLADLLTESVCSGVYYPFRGPFYTQDGEVIDCDGEGLDLEQVITMGWLAENVEGTIPVMEELDAERKDTIESAGTPIADGGGYE